MFLNIPKEELPPLWWDSTVLMIITKHFLSCFFFFFLFFSDSQEFGSKHQEERTLQKSPLLHLCPAEVKLLHQFFPLLHQQPRFPLRVCQGNIFIRKYNFGRTLCDSVCHFSVGPLVGPLVGPSLGCFTGVSNYSNSFLKHFCQSACYSVSPSVCLTFSEGFGASDIGPMTEKYRAT